MKRFAAFVALFALGLAVLLWFQSRTTRVPSPPSSSPPAQAEPLAPLAPQDDLTQLRGPQGQRAQADLSGPLDSRYKPPETGRLRYHLTAANVDLVGEGVFDLQTAHMRFYDDRGDGALESEAAALHARAKLNTDLSADEVLDGSYPITLFEADATLHKGSRFSPLRMRVPVLEGVFATRSFTSRETVDITGRGLTASGRGLEFDGIAETLRLLVNPQASVELKQGEVVRVASRGAFTLKSRPDLGPDALEIEAREQAALELTGARPLKVTADVVRLVGELRQGENERFVPLHAEADGRVVLVPREGTFTGAHATLDFEGGRPARAALDGEPELALELRGERLEQVPPELLVEGETLTVVLSGAGPLELFLGEQERFEFNGPALLELPAVTAKLAATSSIAGALAGDDRFHELAARGSATLDYERTHLDTDDLLVRSFVDEAGHVGARVTAIGTTHVSGVLPDERTFDLVARGGLDAERTRTGLLVTRADDVDLALIGANGFQASADHVRDFDVETLTFSAGGEVEFDGERVRGRGARLDVVGPMRGELSGDATRKAVFEFEQGTFEARYVDFDEQRIQARIDAHALASLSDTDYDITARWVVIERNTTAPERGPGERGLVLDSGGDVRARFGNPRESWDLGCDSLRGFATPRRDENGREVFDPTGFVARGNVRFDFRGASALAGRAERLEVDADRTGRLYPAPESKLTLAGTLPGSELTFEMEADQVEFNSARLLAVGPDIFVRGLDLPWFEPGAPAEQRSVHAIGAYMACDQRSLLLRDAYLGGATATQGDWSFDAPFILLSGSASEAQDGADLAALHDLLAWGDFNARLGALGRASGERIQLVNQRRTVTVSGSPATLARADATWVSTWFDLDLQTGFLRSDAGRVTAPTGEVAGGWSLTYSSLEPVPTPDAMIQVLREPVLTQGDMEIRAAWAVIWVDRSEWLRASGALTAGDPAAQTAPMKDKPQSLFDQFEFGAAARWLRETYLEGDVEYRVEGERRARAEAAYFDLIDGHGWLRDIDLTLEVPFSKRNDVLKVQADWLRHSLDGSLQAVNAVVTSCSFDEPHYVIKIGDFSMLPRWKEKTVAPTEPGGEPQVVREHDGWNFALQNNVIASPGGFEIPMPRIAFPTNEDFELDRDALEVAGLTIPSFGSDSKLGNYVSTSFTRDLGWLAKKFHFAINRLFRRTFGLPDLPAIEGRTKYNASYLGSRGGQVGLESTLDSPGKYHFDVLFDLIYDQGEDRGLVRVPESERDSFRYWFRTRGRYLLGDQEWLDAVLTYQGDPGVQSEFFESDYLEYEERETYLHWRRARGVEYWSATVEARLEDFRTEVVDQPALTYFRGRAQIGEVARLPLVYSSHTTLDHLARFEGEQPYEQPFADGLGERDVTRLDTLQRLETPLALGLMGLRATPFVAGRATGWSDNAAEDDVAGRAVLLAGAELATTFWKMFASGSRHAWTPSVAYRADVVSSDSGLPVAQFDLRDVPVEGEFIDVALRSRWEYRELKSDLDIELRETYANAVPSTATEGWQPIVVRGTWLSSYYGMPFGVTHDGRYDAATGETDYGRTFLGFEPIPALGLETGYQTARDLAGDRLYNALSVGARYALSTKWEVDGDYTFSINENGDRLGSSLTLRRIGHDFVFEIESSFVAGEGASSLKFKITPVLTWKPSKKSMLDRWRELRE